MRETVTATVHARLTSFFGVLARGQTYRNALYLLLAPVPGLLYFVVVAPGLALGVGIATFIGLPLLLLLSNLWWWLATVERRMVHAWLGIPITPPESSRTKLLSP